MDHMQCYIRSIINDLRYRADLLSLKYSKNFSEPKILSMEENTKFRSCRPKIVRDLTSGGRGRGRGRGKMVWGGGTGVEALDPIRRSTQCIQTLRLESTENCQETSQISALDLDVQLGHQVHQQNDMSSAFISIFRRTLLFPSWLKF